MFGNERTILLSKSPKAEGGRVPSAPPRCPSPPASSAQTIASEPSPAPGQPCGGTCTHFEGPADIPPTSGATVSPTNHFQLTGEGHQLLRRGRPEVHAARPGLAAQLPAGKRGIVRPVGAVRFLADLDVKEVLILAAFGAGLVAGVLGEAEAEQPVRVPVELFQVGRLAELVLGGSAVLAVEAVAGDEATDAAHAAPGGGACSGGSGARLNRAARGPGSG